jgi:heme o synthase
MNTRVEVTPARASWHSVRTFTGALWQLTKPRVSRMVFLTSWLGAALAPGELHWAPLFFTVLGTWLIVASANTLNMYLEYDVDALMERTRMRPLPQGLLSRPVALAFGCILGALGLAVLGACVNTLTLLLGAFALITYVLVYTPLKAKSSVALYVGAVPGAMPPVLGYCGISGYLDAAAWALFGVLLVWQIPHFLAITVFRRDEYARAGLKVLPVTSGMPTTLLTIKLTSVLLLLTTFTPWLAGLGGALYLATAVLGGLMFCTWAIAGQRLGGANQTIEQWAKRLFFASMPYLVLLYGVLALGG